MPYLVVRVAAQVSQPRVLILVKLLLTYLICIYKHSLLSWEGLGVDYSSMRGGFKSSILANF